ncbi:MAG TPA: UDP-N-acetylglucosamine 2-epimerase (non-hydrolyzing) [Nitrospiria bacterium]|nr:UDP-N-acetylglucosamine 2-epimerase (non-hydrolyzing) [Nitrospiria bacterium]
MKIILVAGARPNFMKIAPILEAIGVHNGKGRRPRMDPILVHTGQHYDHAMSQSFFEDLGIPRPDINLEAGSGGHAEQTGKVMMAFEPVLEGERPDLVLVVGDVNSTMACSLAAKKLNIAVAHVEAGLRSGDMTMPEEINRKVTDAIADYLFTTDRIAGAHLLKEGVQSERIFFVGNVMIDTLVKHRERAKQSTVLETLGLKNGRGFHPYAVVTLHRPSNVDDSETLGRIFEALQEISLRLPVIFPCHPRTRARLDQFGLGEFFDGEGSRVRLISPLSYLDFLHLNSHANLILTDSGGIQEEATILGVPCLTLRENTERPITVSQGSNRLVGNKKEAILNGFEWALRQTKSLTARPDKWDGRAAERIVEVLARISRRKFHPFIANTSIPTVPGNAMVLSS